MASEARYAAEAAACTDSPIQPTRWNSPNYGRRPGPTSEPIGPPADTSMRTGAVLEHLVLAGDHNLERATAVPWIVGTSRVADAGAGLSETGTPAELASVPDGVRGEDSGRMGGLDRAVPPRRRICRDGPAYSTGYRRGGCLCHCQRGREDGGEARLPPTCRSSRQDKRALGETHRAAALPTSQQNGGWFAAAPMPTHPTRIAGRSSGVCGRSAPWGDCTVPPRPRGSVARRAPRLERIPACFRIRHGHDDVAGDFVLAEAEEDRMADATFT